MEDIKNYNGIQGTLFDKSKVSRLFYITNQRNLMSFLGAGMIMPASCQFRYKEDSRQKFNGAIPFWKEGIPGSSDYMDSLSDSRVVIIECQIDDLMKYGGRYLVADIEQLMVINAPVPLRAVTSIYMSSVDAITDFVMRLPEDVIADRNVFQVLPKIKLLDEQEEINTGNVGNIEPLMSFIDSFGGGVRALNQFITGEITDYSYIPDLLQVCLEIYQAEGINFTFNSSAEHVPVISESDKTILLQLLPILQNIKTEEGVDQIYVLEKLEECLNGKTKESSEEINKWLSYVKRVIEAEIEVPTLADEGDIFKRAVLLFLLRTDLDRLKNSVNSSISPGPIVLSVAAFLAGFTNGLCRMGPEYKGDYRAFNKFTKSLLDSLWCKTDLSLNIVRESTSNCDASLVYEINNEVLFKLQIQQNVILARVLNQAKSAGYALHYDYENQELFYSFQLDGGRKQIVYIELIKSLVAGFDVIRFVSPCLDLTGTKLKTLTKNKAVDFLKRNNDESMYCAFAYSERRKAIVAEAVQIVRTMDDDEFITLLNYVAKVADNYENEMSGRDRY